MGSVEWGKSWGTDGGFQGGADMLGGWGIKRELGAEVEE